MRPYVIINCAMSLDGKLALTTRKQTRISSEDDLARVHKLRNNSDAILVGIGTVLSDDPKLTVKEKYLDLNNEKVKNPVRVVLDTFGRIPKNANVLNESAKTILFMGKGQKLNFTLPQNVSVYECNYSDGKLDLREVLHTLYALGIRKILIEGGSNIIHTFLNSHLVDELIVYIGSIIIGGNAPSLVDYPGAKSLDETIKLNLIHLEKIGNGILAKYKPEIIN